MPRGCLKIIKRKSKVRQSRAKAVIAKIGTSSSTPSISSDVAELKDMVKALLLDKKNQSPAPTPSTTPAPVKAVEPNYVTYGDTHSYQNCHATHENAYQDSIQEYVSQAATSSYNQGNTDFRPQMVANQIRPLGFPPHQNNQNNFNKGNNLNQNQGGNFNQSNLNPSSFNQVQLHGPQVNQASVYHAHIPQTQRVSQIDFESYVKANDAILRNMQSQGQIASMPNLKPSIPYPSRRDNEKCRDQANEQIKKFYEIFKDMSFEISFTDALTLMPKFASTLKALIRNKEKLNEMARTLINEHSITYNLDQTVRYSANYDQMTANKIDVICEIYSQEVLEFFDVTTSGSPTPDDDPFVSTTSPTLIPFGDNDFLLFEEADAFLGLEDDPDLPKINPFYYEPEGDILYLKLF
nr:reverse transcriptase domain-containing protein [Tanacetum cinerariifolium]